MNRFVVFLFGMLFSISLIVGGTYFYLHKTNQDINIDIFKKETEEDAKEEELSLSDNKVKEIIEMYDLNTSSCNEIDRVNYFLKHKKVDVKDLSKANKMYLAYRLLPVYKVENTTCQNYSSVWQSNSSNKMSCGANYLGNSDHYANTSVIKEKDLKETYENIFGKNTYNQIDFFAINYNLSYDNTKGNLGYSYDYVNKVYVLTSSDEKINCNKTNIDISKATSKGNLITITKVITSEENIETPYELVLKYTFKNTKGKYILNKIEKVGE